MKWTKPTRIQQEAIPWALQGRDIIGLAETGSGKTGAFALPIVQRLLDDPQRFYAVCLAPTRELCVQIGEQFEAIGSTIKLQTATVVGGLAMVDQAMALAKRPHVVIATPGRLVDHLENTKGFHLKTIKYLVMDEADRLLSMDFDEALDKILEVVPRDRNTFLFSATMTSKVSKLQRASLKKPVKVEVSSKCDTAAGLVQNFMLIPFKFKHTYFAALVAHFIHYAVMVFTDTCLGAQRLSVFLRHMGMKSICLHGQMSQAQRLGALSGFKAKEQRILVCTDVASRGLDVPSVDLVVNYDIPKNSKDYIHRVGRTARAGRSGRAVTIVTQYDVELFQRVEHFLGKKLEEFTELVDTKVKASHERVLEALRSTELELREQDEGTSERAVKRKMHQQKSKGKKGRRR
ncbi:DDX47 [Symbiodinium sp. CCMP2456]|nr:DDX47 [Symbiodinium sp. CCMP2456]